MRKRYQRIRDLVCEEFCVTDDELDSHNRMRHITEARMVAMKVIVEHTDMRVSQVAYMFGKRQHQCVYNASQRIKMLCDVDPAFRRKYNRVVSAIIPCPNDDK